MWKHCRKEKESTMGNELMLNVGLANKLKLAFRRHGYTNEEVDRLCEGDVLGDILKVLRGFAEIKPLEHVIDLDTRPFCPSTYTINEHRKGGTFCWDPTKVRLFKPKSNGEVMGSVDLYKYLADKPVFNACLLDYLLIHRHLIPEEWKDKRVFFWGTIYRSGGLNLYVRYLCCLNGQWQSGYSLFDFDLHDADVSVLRKN
jgi:hypothetical protein